MSAGFNFDLVITRFGVYPGSTAATEPVALVLRSNLVNETFGDGFACVQLDMHFKHEGRAPRPFAAADIARYHQYLDTFPKITARRKASRIEIQWAIALSPKSFADGSAPSVPGFEQLSAEVVLALTAARPKLVKIGDFEFAALLAKVESTLASIPRGQRQRARKPWPTWRRS